MKLSLTNPRSLDPEVALSVWRDAARSFGAKVPEFFNHRAFLRSIQDDRYLDVFFVLEVAQRRAGLEHPPIDFDADTAGQLWMLYFEEPAVTTRPGYGVGIHLHALPDHSCVCSALYLDVSPFEVSMHLDALGGLAAEPSGLFRELNTAEGLEFSFEEEDMAGAGLELETARTLACLLLAPAIRPFAMLAGQCRRTC